MKLDISYTYLEQGAADIEIDDQDYLRWCRMNPYSKDLTDKTLLSQESRIRGYLNHHLGMEAVSDLVNRGQQISVVDDVDFL